MHVRLQKEYVHGPVRAAFFGTTNGFVFEKCKKSQGVNPTQTQDFLLLVHWRRGEKHLLVS